MKMSICSPKRADKRVHATPIWRTVACPSQYFSNNQINCSLMRFVSAVETGNFIEGQILIDQRHQPLP